MKTKQKQSRPFHLHLEYFFRTRYCLILMLGLLVLAIAKADSRTFNAMRQASVQGFGLIGQYMREETTRVPVTFEVAARVPTYSGR